MAEEKQKSGGLKTALIVMVIMLIVPVAALGAIYFLNGNFRLEANKYLSQIPGGIGAYFSSYPTEQETSDQVLTIADYLLEIDVNRAVDKLALIEADDQSTYDAIVRSMLRIDPNQTETILEEIRKQNLKSNVLLTTMEQIDSEKKTDMQSRASYIDGLTLVAALDEIKSILDENVDGHALLADILEYSTDKKTADYLSHLSMEDKELVLKEFSQEKVNAIKTLMTSQEKNTSELMNTAEILDLEDPKSLALKIGNENTYKIEDLKTIYETLGAKKAGQVLSYVNDDTFTYNLINAIKDDQILANGEDKLTEDILKSLKVYKDFDDNISELNNIFAKMDDQQISEILKRYFRNAGSYRSYPLSNGEEIRITDEDLALAVLNDMPQKKVASVLSSLDNTLSSEISKKLALPNIN